MTITIAYLRHPGHIFPFKLLGVLVLCSMMTHHIFLNPFNLSLEKQLPLINIIASKWMIILPSKGAC